MRGSDDTKFGQVVAGRAGALRRAAYLMCGDWHQAEDLVQVTFMKLYAAWHRVRHQEAFDAYLHRTLVRVCIDEKRRARWRHEAPTGALPDVADSAGPPDELRALLVSALQQLPPRQRATIVLRFFEDRSVEETARALGCTPGTVKSQTAKGLATLRSIIEPVQTARAESRA